MEKLGKWRRELVTCVIFLINKVRKNNGTEMLYFKFIGRLGMIFHRLNIV